MALKILHLEDDPLDAELIEAMLGAGGLSCDIVRVETQEQFRAALDVGHFDLIIADFTLPGFHGRSALSICAEKCPEVPFLFVSGTIGEEAAVESMKNGATDYVLKQRMSRLVPAVRRALSEAEERRKRERAEELFHMALEASPNGVLLVDAGGKIALANRGIPQMFGYQAQELLGQPVEILLPERYRSGHIGLRAEFMLAPRARPVGAGRDLVGIRKDGSEFPVEIGLNPVDVDGRQAIIASIIDITERKRAEAALGERMRLAEFGAEIGLALAEGEQIRAMLQKCAEAMVGQLDAAFARIWTLNEDNHLLELQASAGMYTHIDGGHSRVPLGQFKIGLIAKERKPHLTNAVIGDPRVHDQPWAKREGMVAFAGYPLLVDNRPVGVMALFARRPLSEAVLQAMSSVASEIAVGIERKRAEELAQRNYQRIRALHEIDSAISSTLDLQQVLKLLLEKSASFLPGCASFVRLFDRETGRLERIACHNLDEKRWRLRHRVGASFSVQVVERNAAVTVRNVQTNPETRDARYFRSEGLVSYLGVPLAAKGECVGVLGFYTKEEHEFSAQEIEFASTLAGQAAIAIHNAQLYEEIKRSKEKLEATIQYLDQSLNQLSGLYTALAPLTPSESVERMMDGIIDRLAETTGADAALIRFKDAESGAYPVVGQRGFPDDYIKQVQSAPPGGAVAWVFDNGEPIIASEIAAEPRFKHKIQLQVGLRSAAVLPLKVGQDVRAVVHLASRRSGYFDEEQREHLMAIARQMSVALENREMFDDLKASRDELAKANRIKTEFLSVMSHELRTPLNVIMGNISLVEDGLLGEIAPEQARALQKAQSYSLDLLKMINGILQATQLEAKEGKIDSSKIDLDYFLKRLQSTFEVRSKDIELRWDYPADLPVIESDRARLAQILQNLVANALKFTDKGRITVSVRAGGRKKSAGGKQPAPEPPAADRPPPAAAGGWVEFKVADTGIGIPAHSLPIIFDMFRQIDSSETRLFGGIGLGLYIVKKYAELLGGTVRVESELGKGSTFTVTLPVKPA